MCHISENLLLYKFSLFSIPNTSHIHLGADPFRILVVKTSFTLFIYRITYEGKTIFTVRIIHSLPLRMSVVQVFHQDKMVAVSELVDNAQLPQPGQVCPSYDFPLLLLFHWDFFKQFIVVFF